MTMLQTLVEDSAAMEKEAIRADSWAAPGNPGPRQKVLRGRGSSRLSEERSAQKAYEGFAADTTDSVAKKEQFGAFRVWA